MFMSKSIPSMENDWTKILTEVNFREYDILCPQDAIGAGWASFDILDDTMHMYLNAMKRSGRKMQFWLNCECFTQNHDGLPFMHKRTENRRFIPSPVNRFARQIENAEKYTSSIITFSFNHYYSPLLVNPDYSRVLTEYLESGTVSVSHMEFPDIKVTQAQGKTVLELSAPICSDIALQAIRISALRSSGEKFILREDLPMKPDAALPLKYELGSLRVNGLRLTAIDVAGNESSVVLH